MCVRVLEVPLTNARERPRTVLHRTCSRQAGDGVPVGGRVGPDLQAVPSVRGAAPRRGVGARPPPDGSHRLRVEPGMRAHTRTCLAFNFLSLPWNTHTHTHTHTHTDRIKCSHVCRKVTFPPFITSSDNGESVHVFAGPHVLPGPGEEADRTTLLP